MPDVVYTSATPFADKGSATLVISCSSNAFLPHVREFLEKHLQLPEGTYDYLSLPGGPHFLLLTEYLPKFGWAGQRWVKFLIEKHRLKRAVLITHEDCAWHEDDRMIPSLLQRFVADGPGAGSARERQFSALRSMAEAVHELLPPIAVEAYFAEKATGAVQFLRVA